MTCLRSHGSTWKPRTRIAPLRKDLAHCHTCTLFTDPQPLQKGLTASPLGDCAPGKGNNHTFQGLLHIGSELIRVPGNTKRHCGPPIRTGVWGGQVISGVSAQVLLAVGVAVLQTHTRSGSRTETLSRPPNPLPSLFRPPHYPHAHQTMK